MRHRGLIPLALALASLAGCSDYRHQERPPWRAQAERACLAKGLIRESAAIRAAPEINGPGICGAVHPFRVTALADGTVALNAPQTLDCPMIAELDSWLRDVVQPAAEARFGEAVARIDAMGSYSCRGINNMSGASLSEHAFANALDIGGFVLASGREIDIMRGFNGADEQARAFLHEVHAGACPRFTTVLGPGYNVFHYNHFHVDLAQHGMTSRGPRRYCKPVPQSNLPDPPARDNLPDPPPIEEEMDIARAPAPPPSLRSGAPALVASVPPPVPRAEAYAPPAPTRASPPPRLAPAEPPLITFAETGPSLPAPVPGGGAPGRVRRHAEVPPRGPDDAPAGGAPRDLDATSSIAR